MNSDLCKLLLNSDNAYFVGRSLRYIAFCIVKLRVIYFIFVDDNDITALFIELWLITVLLSLKINSDNDFLLK